MKQKIKDFFNNLKTEANYCIIFVCIILFIYCYFGSFSFFENTFSNTPNLEYWKIIYHNCSAFVLFFIVGLFFTKFIAKNTFTNYGLSKGNYKLGLKLCLIATFVVPILALTTLLNPAMVSTYPLINFNSYEWYYIVGYFISYLMYYVGWEYLFRGILLQGTMRQFGVMGAILVSMLISALIHTCIAGFGKPMIETLSAIPAGLIFGIIASKANSIWYSLYIHMAIGFLTDIFIFLIL